MNNEQLFWMAVIVVFNIVAYLVGRHDGRSKAYVTIVTVLEAFAPNEMAIIRKKMASIDPITFAMNYAKNENAAEEKSDND